MPLHSTTPPKSKPPEEQETGPYREAREVGLTLLALDTVMKYMQGKCDSDAVDVVQRISAENEAWKADVIESLRLLHEKEDANAARTNTLIGLVTTLTESTLGDHEKIAHLEAWRNKWPVRPCEGCPETQREPIHSVPPSVKEG
jgi:hypothetical protein